jgi:hypothetical protein
LQNYAFRFTRRLGRPSTPLAIELGLGKSKELLEQTERKLAEVITGS